MASFLSFTNSKISPHPKTGVFDIDEERKRKLPLYHRNQLQGNVPKPVPIAFVPK